jgi:GPI mannosyltransferase 3
MTQPIATEPSSNAVRVGSHTARNDTTWNLLPFVLAFAFLLRGAVGLGTDMFPHPDVSFQYLEQAHRLTFGYGIIPWEYVYGIRSWIIPGFIALILSALSAIGMDSPLVYQPVVKLIFCGISLVLPLNVYRIAQSILDETSARLAFVATSFWYEIVYVAHTPLADALAAYALFSALMYLFRPPSRTAMLAFGALAGLTLALRYQLGPPVVVACGIAAARWGWRGWPSLITLCVMLILAGALDAYTWGLWFSSIIYNLELNFVQDIAGRFSRDPPNYYLVALATTSLGAAYIGCLGLLLSWRRTWPLSAIGFTLLLMFSLVSHKEERFIFAFVPMYLTGIAALASGPHIRASIRSGPLARIALVLLIPSVLLLILTATTVGTIYKVQRDPLLRSYLFLSERDDVEGIIDDNGSRWFWSPGYYYLHKDVPIYRWDMAPTTTIAMVLEAPTRFATHWITRSDTSPSTDYTLLARIADVRIWRRNSDLHMIEIAPGYTTNAPFPMEAENLVSLSPKVKARW